jgi:hypothetical protein
MIFTQDERSFSLKANPLQSEEWLYSGLWLALVAVNETPPHIALVCEGKYYSLSARKVDNGTPAERFIHAIKRKHVSALFVGIENNNVIGKDEDLQNIYRELQPLSNTETTCLSPIKQFFATSYSLQFLYINYVFELLALAEQQGLLKECVSLLHDSNSNLITLPKYTMEQIRNKIHEIASQIPIH